MAAVSNVASFAVRAHAWGHSSRRSATDRSGIRCRGGRRSSSGGGGSRSCVVITVVAVAVASAASVSVDVVVVVFFEVQCVV